MIFPHVHMIYGWCSNIVIKLITNEWVDFSNFQILNTLRRKRRTKKYFSLFSSFIEWLLNGMCDFSGCVNNVLCLSINHEDIKYAVTLRDIINTLCYVEDIFLISYGIK